MTLDVAKLLPTALRRAELELPPGLPTVEIELPLDHAVARGDVL